MAAIAWNPQTVNAVTGFSGMTGSLDWVVGMGVSGQDAGINDNSKIGPYSIVGKSRSDSYGGYISANLYRAPGNGLFIGWNTGMTSQPTSGWAVEFESGPTGKLVVSLKNSDFLTNGEIGRYSQSLGVWAPNVLENTIPSTGNSSQGYTNTAFVEMSWHYNGIHVRIDGVYSHSWTPVKMSSDVTHPSWCPPSTGTVVATGIFSKQSYSGSFIPVARTMEMSFYPGVQTVIPNISTQLDWDAESTTENPWTPVINTTYSTYSNPLPTGYSITGTHPNRLLTLPAGIATVQQRDTNYLHEYITDIIIRGSNYSTNGIKLGLGTSDYIHLNSSVNGSPNGIVHSDLNV